MFFFDKKLEIIVLCDAAYARLMHHSRTCAWMNGLQQP